MSYTTHMLRTNGTWWAVTGQDSYGKPTFADPVAIKCQSESQTDVVKNAKGEEVVARSRVFLDRAVTIGDYLLIGTSVATDPTIVDGAYRILEMRQYTDPYDGAVANMAFL